MKTLTPAEKQKIKETCIIFHAPFIWVDRIKYTTPEKWKEEWDETPRPVDV